MSSTCLSKNIIGTLFFVLYLSSLFFKLSLSVFLPHNLPLNTLTRHPPPPPPKKKKKKKKRKKSYVNGIDYFNSVLSWLLFQIQCMTWKIFSILCCPVRLFSPLSYFDLFIYTQSCFKSCDSDFLELGTRINSPWHCTLEPLRLGCWGKKKFFFSNSTLYFRSAP